MTALIAACGDGFHPPPHEVAERDRLGRKADLRDVELRTLIPALLAARDENHFAPRIRAAFEQERRGRASS